METNKYTPESISKVKISFSIPLYQRLFEWGENEVTKLLSDLKEHFKKNGESPYFIGMFTTYKRNNTYDLVDGQQRFTVLTLLAIAFGWNNFLKNVPLNFYARPLDKDYLKSKIDENYVREFVDYKNKKMENALACIQKFLDDNFKDDKGKFKEQVYNQLTFFISELPNEYEAADLNKYFEAMNSAGKGLENYEILKVQLLNKLYKDSNKEFYTRIWNAVSEMNKMIIPKKDQTAEVYRNGFVTEIENCNNEPANFFNNCFLFKKDDAEEKKTNNDKYKNKKIGDIDAKNEKPTRPNEAEGERSIISFPELLLLVLDIQCSNNNNSVVYRTDKLIEQFEKFKDLDVKKFFQNLLLYRLLLDYYVIRIQKNDSGNVYDLEHRDDTEDNKESRDCLIQYQSMLYVSTSFYNWLKPILGWLKSLEKEEEISYTTILEKLKAIDNNYHRLPTKKNSDEVDDTMLTYGTIDRYWFWRLDYYLWEKRGEQFTGDKDALRIADNYVFRANRSIEHIAPQTPLQNSSIQWSTDDENIKTMNSFGNLAMISSGQNSSLQNASFEMKKANVESFIAGSKTGSIESLKMLMIYQNKTWNAELIKNHAEAMIDILKNSYKRITV